MRHKKKQIFTENTRVVNNYTQEEYLVINDYGDIVEVMQLMGDLLFMAKSDLSLKEES